MIRFVVSLLPRPDTCHFFFFNDTATTEIYTLSLHDALPIYGARTSRFCDRASTRAASTKARSIGDGSVRVQSDNWKIGGDRKSTRLNSSHANISYAVFCLKKKKMDKVTP